MLVNISGEVKVLDCLEAGVQEVLEFEATDGFKTATATLTINLIQTVGTIAFSYVVEHAKHSCAMRTQTPNRSQAVRTLFQLSYPVGRSFY